MVLPIKAMLPKKQLHRDLATNPCELYFIKIEQSFCHCHDDTHTQINIVSLPLPEKEYGSLIPL